MGATRRKPLSHDTDTGGGAGSAVIVGMVKNQCFGYSCDASLYKSEEKSERGERRVNR